MSCSMRGFLVGWGPAVLLLTAGLAGAAEISFDRDVRPILAEHCFTCHGPDAGSREADLRLDLREGALADLAGTRAVVPGNVGASELVTRIHSTDPDVIMPPPETNKRLSEKDKAILERWITEGAEYEGHWAYRPLERPVPGYVEDELRGYLECGILCFGFARARCTGCGQAFVVAFSCKGRGVCPSSSGRHMAQTAAHLADHVIPPVPVRQWVISVPKRLRGMLADRPRAVAADADMPRAARPRLGGISPATASARRSTTTCISTQPARPITQADLAAFGVGLVFYQEKVPDPFWAQGKRDRHRLLTQTEPVPGAAAADMLAWENSGFSVDATCPDHAQ
jgi:hypothetical protein